MKKATDAAHVLEMATSNARAMEKRFTRLERRTRDFLCINDATPYLQAGNMDLFLGLLAKNSTTIIHASYGSSFDVSELPRWERQLTNILRKNGDSIILR